MAEVLLVSKPIEPPWHDSSKNLVRDLAQHLPRHRPHVMVRAGAPSPVPNAVADPVYGRRSGGFALGIKDHARVLRRLALGPRLDLLHFFFAPNPKASRAAAAMVRLWGRPSVQTVCSAPRSDLPVKPLLFADRVIVLSEHTRRRLATEGIPAERIVHIAPCVPPLVAPAADDVDAAFARHGIPRSGATFVYPGDLEFSAGADRSLEALAEVGEPDARLVVVARDKTAQAKVRRRALAERADAMGLRRRVHFIGETPDVHALLAGASVVLLPSETLYAKMDMPLVLLEAMQLSRPVIVLQGSPAAELAEAGAAVAVEDRPGAVAAALTTLVGDASARAALVARARAYIAGHHAPETMAQRYALVYEELRR